MLSSSILYDFHQHVEYKFRSQQARNPNLQKKGAYQTNCFLLHKTDIFIILQSIRFDVKNEKERENSNYKFWR